MRFEPVYNKGFNWYSQGSCWAKGYIYFEDKCLQGQELVIFFSNLFKDTEPIKALAELNGCFAVVYWDGYSAIAATDKLRSFPLFWSSTAADIVVSDDASVVRENLQTTEPDAVSKAEFRRIYCTSGSHTLYEDIHQICAGNVLLVRQGEARQKVYYNHRHHYKENSQEELRQKLTQVCEAMFQRLVQSLNGRTAVIPLSGGFDSRLIAAMLKKLNYTNVVCYTYGRSNGYEAELAKEVAEKLGFLWYFVEYTPELLQQYFTEDAEVYRNFAFNYASLPHEQDYFALLELRQRQVLPKDAVILPGFCGDLLAGSYLPDVFTLSKLQPTKMSLAQYILQRVYEPDANDEILLNRIQQQISEPEEKQEFVNFFEAWFTVNKVSNYIVNAVRVYEHFGYAWRMPFWDDEWMRLWYSVPDDHRYDKKLYKNWMRDYLLQPYDITRKPKILDSYYSHKNLLTMLKQRVPQPLRKLLKPLLVPKSVQDVNNLDVLRNQICHELIDEKLCRSGHTLNYVNAVWQMNKLKKL